MSSRQKSSLWRRLFPRDDTNEATAPPPPTLPAATTPEVLGPVHERFLRELAEDVADGYRHDDIGNQTFWVSLRGLWEDSHERLATQWAEKFLLVSTLDDETQTELRRQLVTWYENRGDHRRAVPHLEKLVHQPEHSLSAHYQLAEHFRRTGDERLALRHYEAVLAKDVDYPNVRQRVERIQTARGHHRAASGGATLTGSELATNRDSRYRLVRELGRGGSGAVFLAEDQDLGRQVAIKLLHPHLAARDNESARKRFFHEARVTASLRHPNILAILDIEEKARRIVMELAAGGTLQQVLETRGPRTLPRALERHAQVLSAASAAHRKDIVHRDIKPANLMFRADAEEPGIEAVLGDFGVAHLPDQVTQPRKAKQQPIGTLAYMAPEQRSGGAASPKWDVYATAVVLYEMLVGKLPWDREGLLSGARSAEDFRLPQDIRSLWPEQLIASVEKHLMRIGHPDPDVRPAAEEARKEAAMLRDYALCL